MCSGDTVQALCALCDSKEIARIKTAGLENNDDACLQPPNWVPGVGSAVRQRERSAQEARGSSTPTRGRLLCFNILKAQSVARERRPTFIMCARFAKPETSSRKLIVFLASLCFVGASWMDVVELCGAARRHGSPQPASPSRRATHISPATRFTCSALRWPWPKD